MKRTLILLSILLVAQASLPASSLAGNVYPTRLITGTTTGEVDELQFSTNDVGLVVTNLPGGGRRAIFSVKAVSGSGLGTNDVRGLALSNNATEFGDANINLTTNSSGSVVGSVSNKSTLFNVIANPATNPATIKANGGMTNNDTGVHSLPNTTVSNATTAATVTGAQAGTISTAVQPGQTNAFAPASGTNVINSVSASSNSWNLASAVVNATSNAWNNAVSVLAASSNLWNGAVSILNQSSNLWNLAALNLNTSTNEIAQTLHFNTWGSDSLGTGWKFLPYHSLGKAYAVARTLSPSITNQILCLGGAGTFYETNLVLDTEYIHIAGQGPTTVLDYTNAVISRFAVGFGAGYNGDLFSNTVHNGKVAYTNSNGIFFYFDGSEYLANSPANGGMDDNIANDTYYNSNNSPPIFTSGWITLASGNPVNGGVHKSCITRIAGNNDIQNISILNGKDPAAPAITEDLWHTNSLINNVVLVSTNGTAIGGMYSTMSGFTLAADTGFVSAVSARLVNGTMEIKKLGFASFGDDERGFGMDCSAVSIHLAGTNAIGIIGVAGPGTRPNFFHGGKIWGGDAPNYNTVAITGSGRVDLEGTFVATYTSLSNANCAVHSGTYLESDSGPVVNGGSGFLDGAYIVAQGGGFTNIGSVYFHDCTFEGPQSSYLAYTNKMLTCQSWNGGPFIIFTNSWPGILTSAMSGMNVTGVAGLSASNHNGTIYLYGIPSMVWSDSTGFSFTGAVVRIGFTNNPTSSAITVTNRGGSGYLDIPNNWFGPTNFVDWTDRNSGTNYTIYTPGNSTLTNARAFDMYWQGVFTNPVSPSATQTGTVTQCITLTNAAAYFGYDPVTGILTSKIAGTLRFTVNAGLQGSGSATITNILAVATNTTFVATVAADWGVNSGLATSFVPIGGSVEWPFPANALLKFMFYTTGSGQVLAPCGETFGTNYPNYTVRWLHP